MSDPFKTLILDKIENALKKRVEKSNESWGSPIGGDMYTKDDSSDEDVPNVNDDTPYKTHWVPGTQESELLEQSEDEEIPPEEQVPEEGGEEMPPEEGGGEMVDPGMGEEGMPGEEMGAGMPGEEPPKDPRELGRTYELKKIYARLVSIEAYLATTSDEELLILRTNVSKAIEMFQVLSSNITSFKEQIDDIIVIFYDFINTVYSILEKFYKNKSREESKNNKK